MTPAVKPVEAPIPASVPKPDSEEEVACRFLKLRPIVVVPPADPVISKPPVPDSPPVISRPPVPDSPPATPKPAETDKVLLDRIAALEKALADAKATKDGANGRDGKDGLPGKDATPTDLAPVLAAIDRLNERIDKIASAQPVKPADLPLPVVKASGTFKIPVSALIKK